MRKLYAPAKEYKALQNFFKDKTGRVVLWQRPNLPICGWAVFKVLAFLTHGDLRYGCQLVSTGFFLMWALLEITKGVNYFRRLLGFGLLAMVVASYFLSHH
jgi:hypothetical protein